jgi:hypothetical protein
MPEHPLSLYVPCVYCNITKQRMLETFRNMGLGEISRIDFVKREINNIDNSTTHPFNQAFIYFAYWHKNPIVDKLHKEILDPNMDAQLVYSEPYFWRLLPNKNPKYDKDNMGNGDLRSVIMGLHDRVDHQSSLLNIMSERILNLTINSKDNAMPESSSEESNSIFADAKSTNSYPPNLASQPTIPREYALCGCRNQYPKYMLGRSNDDETKSDDSFDIVH